MPRRIYAGTFNGRIVSSTDHADTRIEIADGLPQADYSVVMGVIIVGDRFLMSRFGLAAEDDRNFRSLRVGGEWQTWEPLPDSVSRSTTWKVVSCGRW